MKIGDRVRARTQDLPLRTIYAWYQYAIVVSLEPFVIVSPDATAVWKKYDRGELVVEGRAIAEDIRIASTRYRNDLQKEMTYDFTKDADGNPVVKEVINPNDERTALEVFNLMQEYMELVKDLWVPKSGFLITIDDERLNSAATMLGTLSLRKEQPVRWPLNELYTGHVKVYQVFTTINEPKLTSVEPDLETDTDVPVNLR